MNTGKQDVSDLLENFAGYVNPAGEHDPWFEVTEINQQFAWDDVDETQLVEWLDELVAEGVVESRMNARGRVEWRWIGASS